MTNGTAPAWQVRDIQRQNLLTDLMMKAIAEEDRRDELPERSPISWILELASFILAVLSAKTMGTEISFSSRFDEELIHFFDVHVLTGIGIFARSQEEADVLYLRLAEKLLDMGGHRFQIELDKQELLQPKTIFGVQDRTQKVPIKER